MVLFTRLISYCAMALWRPLTSTVLAKEPPRRICPREMADAPWLKAQSVYSNTAEQVGRLCCGRLIQDGVAGSGSMSGYRR